MLPACTPAMPSLTALLAPPAACRPSAHAGNPPRPMFWRRRPVNSFRTPSAPRRSRKKRRRWWTQTLLLAIRQFTRSRPTRKKELSSQAMFFLKLVHCHFHPSHISILFMPSLVALFRGTCTAFPFFCNPFYFLLFGNS